MKHILEQCKNDIYENAQWKFYFEGMRVGVLDIETTGLNPEKNKFVMGCLYDARQEDGSCETGTLHQVLAGSRAEEQATLAEYMRLVNEMDVVVTYNGRKFDIPFLEKRLLLLNDAEGYRTPCYNLDLFQVLNNYSPIRKLVPNMRQKTVENYMGFWDARADEISGAESIELFNHYEATGDPEAERKILLHNNDDVRQLARLTKAITKCDFHKAMFRQGFPVRCGTERAANYPDTLLAVKKIKLQRQSLEITGLQLKSPINYMCYEMDGWPVQSCFNSAQGIFEVKSPLIRKQGMAIVDLQAAGIEKSGMANSGRSEGFEVYPMYGSGFLVLEKDGEIRYRETNHFVKSLLGNLTETAIRSQNP